MRHCFILFFCVITLTLPAQDSQPERLVKQVPLQLRERSFFTDRIATALIEFDSLVKEPEDGATRSDGYRIVDIEITPKPRTESEGSIARIRFLPTQTGVLTVPSFEFSSETTSYQTQPIQIRISEPQRSDQMSLQLTPEKLQIYAGEPLRIDLTWHCSINAAALQNLKLFPAYFNNSEIEIVIPRTTEPEGNQIGLPIGGRRVIASRTRIEGDKKALGSIRLPLYLRFATPGTYTLPATHLECALLDKPGQDFARYAAHFNNSFFEPVDTSNSYGRIYTTAPAITIEVLPLPIDTEQARFTGLFEPLSIEVSATPTELEIGQLMELELKVSSSSPHGMIDLPPLSQQPGLRERFLLDGHYGRLWHTSGTTFRTRIRPLATSTEAFPSLQFRTFNPKSGQFETIRTEPVPLTLAPSNGQIFIPLSTFDGATVPLSHQPKGIWHNLEKNPMNDAINLITHLLNQLFWPLLWIGPIAFVVMLPIVREHRRRALDPDYARRVAAYQAFKKIPAGSPQKWSGFLQFMASTFGSKENAWTHGDSKQALKKIGAEQSEIEALTHMHEAADAVEFGHQADPPEFKNLNQIAKKIAQLTSKATLILCILGLSLSPKAEASEWTEAEQSFSRAQAAPAGSDAAIAEYTIAALKFQDLAATKQHGGEAWVNAGNAWFQAGEIGRAIAAYRNAQGRRPFDPQLADSLTAARAIALNAVPDTRNWLQKLPTRWIKVGAILFNALFWLTLLGVFRYRDRRTLLSCVSLGISLVILSLILTVRHVSNQVEATIIVDAVYAKKGAGYAYANAFNEPLYDGFECLVLEKRDQWLRIQLTDTRECWIPKSAVQLLEQAW
jgi:cytochrome c-type biogenesis protein CcmH/NrfG